MSRSLAATVALLTVLILGGCGGANTRDLKGVNGRNPDKAELYINVDKHPNIVRLCIDRVAFATTSRENGQNFLRVPEWDSWCGGPAK